MSKKLCFISPSLYPLWEPSDDTLSAGGAEIQFKTIGEALSAEGYLVNFIVDDYGQEKIKKYGDIRVYRTSFRYLGGDKYHLPMDWIKFMMLLIKIDADVYFLKIPKDILLPLGLYCWARRKKLVYVGQSDKDVDIQLLLKLQNKLAICFYRLGLFFVDCALAQTSVQWSGFKKLGVSSEIVKNVVTFPEQKLSDNKDSFVLWVGNDTENKQPDLFYELALRFSQYEFVMIMAAVKNSPNDLKFRKLSNKLSNFQYIGFVPFTEITEYFSRAKIFVNTSLREGFPNVFLQSWQCRVPVLSLSVDPDGVIKKYGLGVCVNGDFEQLCNAVDAFMCDDVRCFQIGEQAEQYINNNHSLEMIKGKYCDVIDCL